MCYTRKKICFTVLAVTQEGYFHLCNEKDNLSFPEAVETLALKAGIDRTKKVTKQEFSQKKKVLTINLEAAKYYYQRLSNTF